MKKAEPTEHAEQCAVMTWAALNAAKWPCLRLLYAVPNGAFFGDGVKHLKNGKTVALSVLRSKHQKAEGLKEGVPDLCLPVPSGVAHRGLYIELKRRTLGKPSAMQVWWRQCLILMGYRAELCHGAAAAIEVLHQHVLHAPKTTLPEMPPPSQKAARKMNTPRERQARIRSPWKPKIPMA
jgi:hypothetical protein